MRNARSTIGVLGGAALVVLSVGTSRVALAVPAEVGVARVSVEDPSGRALDRFFAALKRTAAGERGAVTRIAHYGDSLIVGDLITRTTRRLYQKRFGDAGPGFVLAGRPWPWYRRDGVRHGASEGWTTSRVLNGGLRDQLYGFGGVSFAAAGSHRRVWYSTVDEGESPIAFSKIDVHYLAQPGGGDIDVIVDDEPIVTIATEGHKTRSAFHELRVPTGPHKVVLRTAGRGPVRLFGVALERDGPGVVYDSLGINGACATALGHIDATHLAEQLAHRRPSLLVLMFGANESNRPGLVQRYREALVPVLQGLRRAAPHASCLVMAPMDRAEREDDEYRPNRWIPRIVAAQRESAFEAGCAFYNTYEAMGGERSMIHWYRSGLASYDLTHPTVDGATAIGEGLYNALDRAYSSYRP